MKLFSITLSLLFLGVLGMGVWHVTGGMTREIAFSDTEAGFEEISEELDQLDEVMIQEESLQIPLSQGISIDQVLPVAQGASSGQFSRWGIYWREFSQEERARYANWKRPDGPLRVGLQVGHWKNEEAPEELAGLKRSGGGAVGGGKSEWEVVLTIAKLTQKLLEDKGISVDLLPATVPESYVADAFVSIHADGNNNLSVSGFKISEPRRDFSGLSASLAASLYEEYENATGMDRDTNITRRMSGYYAFNWRRYAHAVHPMTPSVIIETGFLTSSADQKILIRTPERAAKGIAEGILKFLNKN